MPHYLFIHKLGVCQGKYFDALLTEQVQERELQNPHPKTLKQYLQTFESGDSWEKKAVFLLTYFPG